MAEDSEKEQSKETKSERDNAKDRGKVVGNGQDKKNHKKLSRSQIIAIIAVIFVIILVGIILYLVLRNNDRGEVLGKATIVTEDNVDEVIQSGGEVEDPSYTATMTNEWTFKTGTSSSEGLYIANTENNKRTVYFNLLLKGSQKKIYSSPYIPVGGEIDSIQLDEPLDAGDYDAIVEYHLVDDEKNELTTVSVAVVIHVLK